MLALADLSELPKGRDVAILMLNKEILQNGCRIGVESPEGRRRRHEDLERMLSKEIMYIAHYRKTEEKRFINSPMANAILR